MRDNYKKLKTSHENLQNLCNYAIEQLEQHITRIEILERQVQPGQLPPQPQQLQQAQPGQLPGNQQHHRPAQPRQRHQAQLSQLPPQPQQLQQAQPGQLPGNQQHHRPAQPQQRQNDNWDFFFNFINMITRIIQLFLQGFQYHELRNRRN